MTGQSIGVRVQRMPVLDQVLVLASVASGRAEDGTFSGRTITQLFYDASLPAPGKIGNAFATLKQRGYAAPAKAHGAWSLTPLGRERVSELVGDDAVALLARIFHRDDHLDGRRVLVPRGRENRIRV